MSTYLYHTTLPVLLGGKQRAGRLAKTIWRMYGLTSHWFGVGHSYSLTAYAEKHPLPHAITQMSPPLLRQILLDFAKEASPQNILVLIPCDAQAVAFIEQEQDILASSFLILPQDIPLHDPLSPLVITKP